MNNALKISFTWLLDFSPINTGFKTLVCILEKHQQED